MRVVLLLVTLLVVCSCQAENREQKVSPMVEEHQTFRVDIPKDGWEPIFFREINERAAIAKLPSLRTAALPKGDLETRIWIGFGLTALKGFDIKRSGGEWQGAYIQGIYPDLPRKEYEIALQPPKSGWEALWQKLVDTGILILPDAESIGCEVGGLDGVSYVVENNIDNTYRTYMYENPQFATCKEAQQMIQIIHLLGDEFRPQLPQFHEY